MASPGLLLASLLLLLAFCMVTSRPVAEPGTLASEWTGRSLLNNTANAPMNCKVACAARCRLASRQKMCKRACGTCCGRCNCVPPGTSGNTQTCPCYAKMTTYGGRLKCP